MKFISVVSDGGRKGGLCIHIRQPTTCLIRLIEELKGVCFNRFRVGKHRPPLFGFTKDYKLHTLRLASRLNRSITLHPMAIHG